MHVYTINQHAPSHLKEQIADLFLSQVSMTHTEESFHQMMEAIDTILDDPATSRIVVVEKDGLLYGMAHMNIGISLRTGGYYLWLNELLVKESFRNKGIGKKLLIYIIHWAESEGIRSIELETGVNNSVTKHLYNSLGFYEVIAKRYGFSF